MSSPTECSPLFLCTLACAYLYRRTHAYEHRHLYVPPSRPQCCLALSQPWLLAPRIVTASLRSNHEGKWPQACWDYNLSREKPNLVLLLGCVYVFVYMCWYIHVCRYVYILLIKMDVDMYTYIAQTSDTNVYPYTHTHPQRYRHTLHTDNAYPSSVRKALLWYFIVSFLKLTKGYIVLMFPLYRYGVGEYVLPSRRKGVDCMIEVYM